MFGRAYDPSEITGDHGVATSIELRYLDLTPTAWQDASLEPYVFCDLGKVWNKDSDGEDASASSVAAGMRLFHRIGFVSDIAVA